MVFTQLKALWPTIAAHWGFTFILFFGCWTYLKSVQPHFTVSFKTIFTMALGFSLWGTYTTFNNLWQAATLVQLQMAQQSSVDQAKRNDPLQMKADFLRTVDALSTQPNQIDGNLKAKLFQQFAPLFQKPEDRMTYEHSISQVYECQRSFWEDALATRKSHHIVKSKNTEECRNFDGAFFNRPHLIPEQVAADNDKTLETLATGKAHKDDKNPVMDEKTLRSAVDEQSHRLDAVKKIFE